MKTYHQFITYYQLTHSHFDTSVTNLELQMSLQTIWEGVVGCVFNNFFFL